MLSQINIITRNVRSIETRLIDIYAFINTYNSQKICLSEIMLNPSDFIRITNYQIIFKARNSHGGGSAILVRNDVVFATPSYPNFIIQCSNNGIDVTIIYIKLQNEQNLYITSIYNPPSNGTNHTESGYWEDTFNFLTGLGEIIITGDFNGHAEL